jgi:uridine kinase
MVCMIVIQKKMNRQWNSILFLLKMYSKRFKCNGHHSVYIEPRKQITDRSFDMNKIENWKFVKEKI